MEDWRHPEEHEVICTDFLNALPHAGPQFNIDDLAVEVSNRVELQTDVINGTLSFLATLYLIKNGRIRNRRKVPISFPSATVSGG